MPKLLAALFAIVCLYSIGDAHAADSAPQPSSIHWQYKLSDAVVTKTGADGKETQALNMDVVDYFLPTISGYIDQYATAPGYAGEKSDIADKLARLTTVLHELDDGPKVNLDILRREAFAYNLAYKLGFPDADPMTDMLYKRLLKQTPDEPAANYLYGAYLAGHDEARAKSILYLKKALTLGVKKANLTLGIVYMSLGEKQEALDCLQQYSADFPDDPRARMIMQTLKNKDAGSAQGG